MPCLFRSTQYGQCHNAIQFAIQIVAKHEDYTIWLVLVWKITSDIFNRARSKLENNAFAPICFCSFLPAIPHLSFFPLCKHTSTLSKYPILFKNCSLKSLWVFLIRLLAFSGVSWQLLHMMMQYPRIFQPTSMEFLEILQQEKQTFCGHLTRTLEFRSGFP